MNDAKYIIVNQDGEILFKTYDGRYMFVHKKILPNMIFDSEAQAQNWINHNSYLYGNVPVSIAILVRKKRDNNE